MAIVGTETGTEIETIKMMNGNGLNNVDNNDNDSNNNNALYYTFSTSF